MRGEEGEGRREGKGREEEGRAGRGETGGQWGRKGNYEEDINLNNLN